VREIQVVVFLVKTGLMAQILFFRVLPQLVVAVAVGIQTLEVQVVLEAVVVLAVTLMRLAQELQDKDLQEAMVLLAVAQLLAVAVGVLVALEVRQFLDNLEVEAQELAQLLLAQEFFTLVAVVEELMVVQHLV
jgi:hypothetical protein